MQDETELIAFDEETRNAGLIAFLKQDKEQIFLPDDPWSDFRWRRRLFFLSWLGSPVFMAPGSIMSASFEMPLIEQIGGGALMGIFFFCGLRLSLAPCPRCHNRVVNDYRFFLTWSCAYCGIGAGDPIDTTFDDEMANGESKVGRFRSS